MKKIYSLLLLFVCALQGVLANQQQQADYYYGNGAGQYSNDYQYNVYNQPVASKSVSSKGKVWKVIGAVVGVVVVIVLIILGYKYRLSIAKRLFAKKKAKYDMIGDYSRRSRRSRRRDQSTKTFKMVQNNDNELINDNEINTENNGFDNYNNDNGSDNGFNFSDDGGNDDMKQYNK